MEEEMQEELEEQESYDDELTIQNFMNDMQMVGDQVRSKDLVKPNFHYGDISVTNYLLWLMLGEIKELNRKLGEI